MSPALLTAAYRPWRLAVKCSSPARLDSATLKLSPVIGAWSSVFAQRLSGGIPTSPVALLNIPTDGADLSSLTGEVPMLYVVLRASTSEILADLHAHMRQTVPEPPARPKSIVPLPALPITAAGKVDKPALRRDAAVRVAKETIGALPAFAGPDVDVIAHNEPSGQVVVTVSLAKATESDEGLTEAAERLLSGFPFDHKIVFRNEEEGR
jgi:hypothetical protein